MTTYRSIATTETDADSPVTATLMSALANNPTAIAEGASGAPKVADKVLSASGTTTFSSLDDFGGLWVRGGGREKSASTDVTLTFQIQFSTDGGGTFSTAQTLYTKTYGSGAGGIIDVHVEIFFNLEDGTYKGYARSLGGDARELDDVSYSNLTGTVTGMSSGVTDIKLIGLDGMVANPQGGETAV